MKKGQKLSLPPPVALAGFELVVERQEGYAGVMRRRTCTRRILTNHRVFHRAEGTCAGLLEHDRCAIGRIRREKPAPAGCSRNCREVISALASAATVGGQVI